MSNPSIFPMTPHEARRRINVLCWYFPDLLGAECGEKRLSRAAILACGFVIPYMPPFQYFVESQRGTGLTYIVDIEEKTCECPDHANGFICKHRIAVALFTQAPEFIHRLETENPRDAEEILRGLFVENNQYSFL